MNHERGLAADRFVRFADRAGRYYRYGRLAAVDDAEWLAFLLPAVAVWFGWQNLFETTMFAVWI